MKVLLNRYLTHQETRPEFMTHEALIGYVQEKEQCENEEIFSLQRDVDYGNDIIQELELDIHDLKCEIDRLNYLLEKDDKE